MTRDVLVSGMFRSGTTLLSRMLSATPRSLVVADPFVYFFKAYRNFHYRAAGVVGWHPEQPTSDYFGALNEGDQRILEADFSEAMPAEDLARLCAEIRAWKADQHPELCARLGEVRQGTFAAVYRQLIELCASVYGTAATELVGTKVSWSEEFLPALARAFPEMRFVLLLRDLRAIVASQNAKSGPGAGKRPLLFYVRHWRKSVAFLRRFSEHDAELATRCLALRYEDVVAAPEPAARRLAGFLELPFQPEMVTASAFRAAGAGGTSEAAWSANSSYGRPGRGIYTESRERWRQVLAPAEIDALNALAGPELELMGYAAPQGAVDATRCEPAFEELAPWLQAFECAAYLRDSSALAREYAREAQRRALLEQQAPAAALDGLFLDERIYADLRSGRRAGFRASA